MINSCDFSFKIYLADSVDFLVSLGPANLARQFLEKANQRP